MPIMLSVLVFVLGAASAAESCSCAPGGSPLEQRIRVDAVLDATVLDATYPPPRAWRDANGQEHMAISGGDMVRWTLRVNHVWKGVGIDTVTLYSARDGAACGYEFELGERYLVYGWWRDSLQLNPEDEHDSYTRLAERALSTGICSRTAHVKDALYDLHSLGVPTRSRPGEVFPDISVEGILRQLSSGDDRLRWAATEALVLLGRYPKEVVLDLVRRLREGEVQDQLRAINTLRRIGPAAEPAVPVLTGIMSRSRRSTTDDYLVEAIARALPEITGEPVWPPIPAVHGGK